MVTIGIFDGVHLGHQKILNRLIEAANEINGQALLLSFFPHPRVVLNPGAEDLRLIIHWMRKSVYWINLDCKT